MADQQWTWAAPESSEGIKRSMTRQDGHDRVSGEGLYTRDICLPGMLYAKILTSPYAHAKIVSMDTREAEALVGVRDILKYEDPDIAKDGAPGSEISMGFNILTLPGTSDFFQHPMGVVVVADSEEICDRALRLIKIKWEERPFILDMEEAAKPDAQKIMPEVTRMSMMGFGMGGGGESNRGPNVIQSEDREIGNIQKGFEEADKVVEYTIKRGMNSPAGTEAMVCVAQWKNDSIDLYVHHQSNPRNNLETGGRMGMGGGMPFGGFGDFGGFGGPGGPGGFVGPGGQDSQGGVPRPPSPGNPDRPRTATSNPPVAQWRKINVTFPYQGSWFGGLAWLGYTTAFVRMATLLAKRIGGKPVKLLYDESSFYCGGDEVGYFRCKVGAKKDGTITAYHWNVLGQRNPAIDKTYECTKIPNIRGTQTWALTNKGFTECYRHGAACCVPHNVMFDRVAAEFGLDPTEVALKNDGCQGHDWAWITNYQKENGFPQRHSLKEVIEIGKKAMDWDRKWHAPGARKLANGRMHGMGFTSINEWSWGVGMPLPSSAALMLCDGKVTILGLRSDMGIDTESGYRHCVAAESGMKYEDVLIQEQHVDNSTYCLAQPASSAGTVTAMPQLIQVARELKKKILERAVAPTSMMGMPPGFMFNQGGGGFPGFGPSQSQNQSQSRKIEDYDIQDGMIFEKANPSKKRAVSEVIGGGGGFMGGGPFGGGGSSIMIHPDSGGGMAGGMMGMMGMGQTYIMSRQAHFIEAEVDAETGLVLVANIVCVNDVGHIFNRKGAEGQQYGGAVMGLGRSATEEKVYCPNTGVGLNYDHINYHIGTMNDYPIVQCFLNESHLGYGPYGSNGIGENIGASMSAITSSAIYNAIGKWILDFPITPDKVLKALGTI
jgi:CO/xanthine dehydrogenase Mo-binding subunit